MSRPFAVFDIDGTLIRWQLYHAIADELVKLGFADKKDYQAIKEARMSWKRRAGSFKDYEHQLVESYKRTLKTVKVEEYETAAQAVFDKYKDQVYTYTRDFLAELKGDNYLLLAISGSQAEVIAKLADYYGFDDYIGTTYERKGSKFSGKSIFHAADKAKALKTLVLKHGVDFKGSIAVGDSVSDIPMMELVEQPIAFNPERELFNYAQVKKWKIVIERKNMIYELESANGRYVLDKTN